MYLHVSCIFKSENLTEQNSLICQDLHADCRVILIYSRWETLVWPSPEYISRCFLEMLNSPPHLWRDATHAWRDAWMTQPWVHLEMQACFPDIYASSKCWTAWNASPHRLHHISDVMQLTLGETLGWPSPEFISRCRPASRIYMLPRNAEPPGTLVHIVSTTSLTWCNSRLERRLDDPALSSSRDAGLLPGYICFLEMLNRLER